jgi:carbonic anhydrase
MPGTRLITTAVGAACAIGLAAAPGAMAQDPEWAYEGPNGPANWGSLSPAFAPCQDGLQQSPIDLVDPLRAPAAPIRTRYTPSPVTLEHNGETIEGVPERTQRLRVGAAHYGLAQFHFHAPSEHVINGRRAPLEIHFVHADAAGNRAVLGALVRRGQRNAAFARLAASFPRSEGAEREVEAPVDLDGLLPTGRTAYRYAGSLTTPPCSEGIQWMVLAEPVELSRRQIRQFRRIVDGNSRPTQPHNGRTITLG